MKHHIQWYAACMVLSSFLWASGLWAQPTPLYFELTLHLEDAQGNRDSVVIGAHPDATEGIDSEFGEAHLPGPFDAVFEARLGSRETLFHGDKLTKRFVNRAVGNNFTDCLSFGYSRLYIHAIHQPVKIWWDKSVLSGECFGGSFVINHYLDEIAGPLEPEDIPSLYYCMGIVDTGIFEMTEEGMEWDPQISTSWEISGQGLDTIYGVRVAIGSVWDYPQCYWEPTGTKTPPSRIGKLNIYPSPTPEEFRVSFSTKSDAEALSIYDAMGRLVFRQQNVQSGDALDISEFPAGVYALIAQSRDGGLFTGRVVKH